MNFSKIFNKLIHGLASMAIHNNPKKSRNKFRLAQAIRIDFPKHKTRLSSAIATEVHILF